LWKIPPKPNLELRQLGESKAATIIAKLTSNQDKHYGRDVMSAYMGSVVHLDFMSSKAASNAVWQFITVDTVYHKDVNTTAGVIWALGSGDEGGIIDMRAMHGKTEDPAFDPFWKELEHQLHSYKTVHSRRYG
jgi:hypothetical protein